MVAQSKIDLLTQIWSLRADVRRAYLELVVAQETQKTLEQLYDLASRLLDVTAKRLKAGAVPQLDALKARLAASQASLDVIVGKRRVVRAKQQLNILLGRTADSALFIAALPDFTSEKPREQLRAEKSDILPDYSREVPPLKEFIDRALGNRLELKSLAMQVKVNQANLAGAYGNVLPSPTLALGKSTSGNPAGGPKLNAVFFTVNAEIPLSNTNQGAIWQYRATGRQLNYQIAAQQNQVTSDVTAAYNNLLAARKKLRLYQDKLLTDSNLVARLSRRSYEVGQSDITAALNAQQANVQTQNAYLDAVNAYGDAFTSLEFAIGKPLQ
jgi:cobalt-zinc-cadmium efflux system outer membrane protein